jgi:hypothetical protein
MCSQVILIVDCDRLNPQIRHRQGSLLDLSIIDSPKERKQQVDVPRYSKYWNLVERIWKTQQWFLNSKSRYIESVRKGANAEKTCILFP